MDERISVALVALGFGLETPLVEIKEGGMYNMVLPFRGGEHVFEPWGHGVDGAVPQVVGVGIKFGDICGFLLFLSCSESHLSIVPLLDPLGNNLETSSNRDEGVDPPVVVLETFRSIQIDCPFGLCEMLHEVVDKGLLPFQCGFHSPNGVCRLLLLISDILDEAIDDLLGCRCVGGVGGQCRECRVR